MIDQKYVKVLSKLHARLAHSRIEWAVTGSLSLALQGLPVEVKDIDIETDEKGVYRIETLFSEFSSTKVAFSSGRKIRSHFGVLLIDGLLVEIMGDVELLAGKTWIAPIRLRNHTIWVKVGKLNVPCMSLDHEYQAYEILGRKHKMAIIRPLLRLQE